MLGFDDGDAGAGGPDFELFYGCCPEGVRCTQEGGAAIAGEQGGEFAGGGGFAGSVDADHHDDFGGRGGVRV